MQDAKNTAPDGPITGVGVTKQSKTGANNATFTNPTQERLSVGSMNWALDHIKLPVEITTKIPGSNTGAYMVEKGNLIKTRNGYSLSYSREKFNGKGEPYEGANGSYETDEQGQKTGGSSDLEGAKAHLAFIINKGTRTK